MSRKLGSFGRYRRGTTDITIYSEGSIVHTAVLALGGNHLTHDIAIGLSTPLAEAEEIKHEHELLWLIL